MNKILLTLILLPCFGIAASAQEALEIPNARETRQWDINASAGFVGTPTLVGAGEGVAKGIGDVIATIITLGLYKPHSEYGRIDNKSIPAVALQGGYQILPWLKITLDGFYNYSISNYFKDKDDSQPEKTVRANRVSLLPGLKFTYLNKGIFHMYSGVAIGGALSFNMTTQNDQTGFNSVSPHFAWQVTTVGFSFGNTFYGYTDFGLGSEYVGIRIGAGYKF